MKVTEWENKIKMEQKQKDVFFSSHPQSPILAEKKFGFKGLDYYLPDQKYVFEIKLHEYTTKESINVPDTQGNEREFLRWGEFRFKIHDTECKLQAYNPWCAYSEFYACPFTPTENWLKVPVCAGEKDYKK